MGTGQGAGPARGSWPCGSTENRLGTGTLASGRGDMKLGSTHVAHRCDHRAFAEAAG